MTSYGTRSNFTVIFAAALLFLCGQFVRAAENNSAIEGVVQDGSGKPVSGAFVKLNYQQFSFTGITILAKDGQLYAAEAWSCGWNRKFFNNTTAEDAQEYYVALDAFRAERAERK